MAELRDTFPRKELELAVWAGQFAQHIEPVRGRFEISHSDVQQAAMLAGAFKLALRMCRGGDTGSRVATAHKNQVRDELKTLLRQMIRQVRSRKVESSLLATLGLKPHVPHTQRPMLEPPNHAPRLNLLAAAGKLIEFELVDALRPFSWAKPTNAKCAMLLVMRQPQTPSYNPVPTTTVKGRAIMNCRPTKIELDLPLGTSVWMAAAWQTRTGHRGPWSRPHHVTLGGGVSAQYFPEPASSLKIAA